MNLNIPVFRATENPATIVRGTHGAALTIDISFGDEEISEWIGTLKKPYPLLLLDAQWIERSPEIIELIKEKKIPTGLLGGEGKLYEENDKLLPQQLKQYSASLGDQPIWFRTSDDLFPKVLHSILWEEQINALSSSLTWTGGHIPAITEGEIIAVPHHLHKRIDLEELQQFMKNQDFQAIDEVLFGPVGTFKKFPH